jgi:predicted P-loop ATPase
VTAEARLQADRAELARFVDATFQYADDGTHAALRTFAEGSSEVLDSVRVPLNGAGLDTLIDHAVRQATKAANARRPAVFAPPVATFIGDRTRERDLANGLVLAVEADQAPAIARRNLQFVLGPPTVVVASGGHWTDPETGEVEHKLHLHWRCREPSRSGAEHATLKQARALACAFVGGDASAISLVHPLRWPGSWHRKNDPRLARIVDLRPDVEIEPSEIVGLLEPLIPVRRAGGPQRSAAQHTSVLDDHDLAALGETIANADRAWPDWNRLGMAFFAASNGSDAGLAAFDRVSQRSAKYDACDTRRRWEHFHQSPPHRLGPGTLIYEARQVDPAFRLRSRQGPRQGRGGGTSKPGVSDESIAGPEEDTPAPDEQPCEWRTRLVRNDKGSARDCVANIVLILRSDARFIGRLRFDELYQATFACALPWDRSSTWRLWSDTDDIELAHWCQLRGVILKPPTCAAGIQMVASHHRHHAVREYLDNLCWDGTPRLDIWLETYLGARIDAEALDAGLSDDDLNREQPTPSQKYTTYLRSVGPKWLIAAVARIYRPGCKVDHVIVFEGPQGVGKSTCLRVLAGDEWFADEIADLGTKDSAQDLRGKWIVELAEVAALRRAALERMKAFISRNIDHYRPSYGRRSMDFPRQCVFAGTTNADAYLADETGNRRFWPVKVTGLRLEQLVRDRDQLWAEAVVRFKAGEAWWLDREVEAFAAEEQNQRRQGDPWEEPIFDWLGRPTKTEHAVAEILSGALQREVGDWTQADLNRVARCLRANGYERVQVRDPARKDITGKGRRIWVYRPVSPVQADRDA